jgi:hypothetical protein
MKCYCVSHHLLVGVFLLTGCVRSTSEPDREFFTNFSIREIVES